MLPSVCSSVCPSVHPPCYLPCYMTSPHGKSVREQHYFFHPSICQAISNISMEHGDFAMACYGLRNLVLFLVKKSGLITAMINSFISNLLFVSYY